MRVLSKEEFLAGEHVGDVLDGKIFVYPTDTIYGIGCDARNSEAVFKIRELKERDEKPFSVIAPSKNWILENCIVDENVSKWLKKLPGAYTLILKLKNKAVANGCNFGETLGVRIPRNWFADFVSKCGVPFVTTSVNVSGEKPVSSLNEISDEMKEKIDYFIDDGLLSGKPSTIVDLSSGKERIFERN